MRSSTKAKTETLSLICLYLCASNPLPNDKTNFWAQPLLMLPCLRGMVLALRSYGAELRLQLRLVLLEVGV